MSNGPGRLACSASKLPAQANLEHLKNEAKQRLKSMRGQTPGARLADAQLQVARSYGFPSWRRLKAYVDALNDFGQRLINSVRDGDLETIRATLDRRPELVNAGADVPERLRPSDAVTMRLVHLAIAVNQADVLRLLIERGADLNVRNASGRLPLHDCFELGHDDFAKMLLDAGAMPDVCAAAAYGMHDRLRQILSDDPALANDLSTGESPLGWSVYGAQPESARILFEHGALADRPPYDEQAWRPAAMVASTTVAPVLLAHGADPNWQDNNGDTAMHRAIRSRVVVNPAIFIKILLDAGADPTLRNHEGRTPLEEAEALFQAGKSAETYYPVRTIGPKKLEETIAILHAAMNSH